jgi:uncharacterized membrane protein HdeD (DUF308 family)
MVLFLMARAWWMLVLRGVLAVLFGILALVWPEVTITALVFLFGAYAIVDGLLELAIAIGGRQVAASLGASTAMTGGERIWLAIEGVVGVAAGVIAFVWPGITALVLLWLIAFWAIVTGVLEIVAAIRLRKHIDNEWWLVVAGAASVVFGLILMLRPGEGAIAVVWLIGVYALIFGAIMIALGLRLRGAARTLRIA